MAEVRVTTKKVVALILNEAEARWLMTVLQNPMSGNPDPNDEDMGDKEVRHSIFSALNSAGLGYGKCI